MGLKLHIRCPHCYDMILYRDGQRLAPCCDNLIEVLADRAICLCKPCTTVRDKVLEAEQLLAKVCDKINVTRAQLVEWLEAEGFHRAELKRGITTVARERANEKRARAFSDHYVKCDECSSGMSTNHLCPIGSELVVQDLEKPKPMNGYAARSYRNAYFRGVRALMAGSSCDINPHAKGEIEEDPFRCVWWRDGYFDLSESMHERELPTRQMLPDALRLEDLKESLKAQLDKPVFIDDPHRPGSDLVSVACARCKGKAIPSKWRFLDGDQVDRPVYKCSECEVFVWFDVPDQHRIAESWVWGAELPSGSYVNHSTTPHHISDQLKIKPSIDLLTVKCPGCGGDADRDSHRLPVDQDDLSLIFKCRLCNDYVWFGNAFWVSHPSLPPIAFDFDKPTTEALPLGSEEDDR